MATIEKYQTKSGGTLYAVRYRQPNNKQTWKRGFTTQRDAKAFANTLEASKLTGSYVAPSLGRITVGALGPGWLERQQGHMKPSAFRPLQSAWRVHVEPRWSATAIADVRYSDVAAWTAELSGHLSASTVSTVYSVLARVLDDAVRDRLLASNPARGVKLPRRARRKNVYLSVEQLHRLADESGRYRGLVLLLGVGGLRWGEAAALRVADIDFLRRRVHLHRNAVMVGGTVVVGTLKSGQNRTVVLPASVTDALAQTAQGKGRDGLLWPAQGGGHVGPPTAKSWLSGAVERCQKTDKTFPRITAHALRHTAASLAISAGANPKVVQRMLGKPAPP
jgi:integrase